MAEMPDRHAINMEIDRIISRHRDGIGNIPTLDIALLRNDLVAHMDETVKEALDYGVEIGRMAVKGA